MKIESILVTAKLKLKILTIIITNYLLCFFNQIQRKLKNFEAEQPHMHAIFYMSYLLSEQAWDKVEILQTLAGGVS